METGKYYNIFDIREILLNQYNKNRSKDKSPFMKKLQNFLSTTYARRFILSLSTTFLSLYKSTKAFVFNEIKRVFIATIRKVEAEMNKVNKRNKWKNEAREERQIDLNINKSLEKPATKRFSSHRHRAGWIHIRSWRPFPFRVNGESAVYVSTFPIIIIHHATS